MGKYFGTDGFRGEANVTLDANHAFRIGRFLGWYYSGMRTGQPDRRARVAVGKDTRRSSYMLEYALAAGLTASGADAYMLHVTTTPSVSFVTAREDFDCGVMISASHNPYMDNGIKLVNCRGEKMDDRATALIEAYLDGETAGELPEGELPLATGEAVGRIIDYSAGRNRYVGYLISLAAHSYKGFRVGLDCANGASWMIAKAVFDALGAKTYVIGAEPNGVNINVDAGSTHIDALRRLVMEEGLDVGFAFDGDADRCIAVDERGEEVNGDHILYVLGRALQEQGMLSGNTVVATVMSNMGLFRALDEAGMRYEQTAVGDRFVYENMVQNGYALGGEQSGHIILRKYATTGDGILTAIMLMEQIVESKLPLSKLAEPVVMFPQVSRSVRVPDKEAAVSHPAVRAAAEAVSCRLEGRGRILLRKSGTEPVVRVMVESESEEMCHACVNEVIAVMKNQGLTEEE